MNECKLNDWKKCSDFNRFFFPFIVYYYIFMTKSIHKLGEIRELFEKFSVFGFLYGNSHIMT